MLPWDVGTLTIPAMRTRSRHREAGSLPKVTQQVSLACGVNRSLAASAVLITVGMGRGWHLANSSFLETICVTLAKRLRLIPLT